MIAAGGRKIGAVILAGGKASRFGGGDKGLLRLGGRPFLDRIVEQLSGFPEVLLSVDAAGRYPDCLLPRIVDAVPDAGPMQGLAQALQACRSDALLAVAADMPLFSRGLADYLVAFFHRGCDAVIALDRDGRRHPLCAVYSKKAGELFRRQVEAGRRKMGEALALLDAVDAPLVHSIHPDAVLANVNTPADFAKLRRLAPPPILAICGVKDSGKTTLLCRLIPLLRQAGLRVGVIKHDGHDFVPDVPGTDSQRLRESGAERVAVYSPHRFMLIREGGFDDVAPVLPHFDTLDLILVEGGKHSSLPKLEVVRAHRGGVPQSRREGLLAICSDVDVDAGGLPVLGLNDIQGVSRFVLEFVAAGG